MQNPPLVSVILPVYNGERYLADALQSILNQECRAAIEILVIDDGSTDRSADIARSFERVRLFSQKNQGVSTARNKGLRHARGDYIAFCDADDMWPDGKLSIQLELLQSHPELDGVMGKVQFMVVTDTDAERKEFKPSQQPRHSANLGAGLFRRSLPKKIDGFDESLVSGEDLDWFIRAKENNCLLLYHDDLSLLYRLHGQNSVCDKQKLNHGLVSALHKSMHRRGIKS